MWSLAQRQSVADDLTLVVVLSARGSFERGSNTPYGPAQGSRERFARHWLTGGECAQ
jgi:hypothetical protein